jgi:ribosomal protein L32
MAKKQTKKGGKVVRFSSCPKCGQAIQRDHDCMESKPDSAVILRAARSDQYRRLIVGHKILA